MKVSGFPLFQYVKDRGGGGGSPGSRFFPFPDSGGYVIPRSPVPVRLRRICYPPVQEYQDFKSELSWG
ncbi:hypothetical protein [Bacteroides cellulosilyticus]|uniref:Uncharacterized protein n=1 Tax=Bacteroides cellulosilyticus DSM 14838 TaxID=537012 RepID=E2N7M7_9BACE|nr:hypothetical protein [Bacteroides cellulosilyticus]EEF92078.1 hypothetical protein BACCELL_00270 [Bacteroides cellulosilyticus DSM 14838]MBN9710318.1 hypothetical protein [Bacteroides cellulosilyticus]MDC7304976.1 hypothetical protein [Bacteroides cellulosilyticus DSM 14838]